MVVVMTTPTRRGRPPSGPKGTKRSKFPQLSVRVATESIVLLKALKILLGRSQADIVADALVALRDRLPRQARADVAAQTKLLSKRKRHTPAPRRS